MIETFDVRTLIFVLPVGHAVAALVLLFGTRNRDDRYDTVFMSSMAIQAVGWLLLFFRGVIPDILSFGLANALIFCGFCLEGIALLTLVRPVDAYWKKYYAVVLAISLMVLWLPLSRQDLIVGFLSFVIPFFFIFPGIFMIFSSPRPSSLQKFIGSVILIYIAAVLARGVYILVSGSYALTVPTFFQVIYLLLQIAMLALVSTGYILIKREFAGADLEKENAERQEVEKELREMMHTLGERIKELHCLYETARLIETIPAENALFPAIARILPPAWQYPDLTCAKILIDGREFVSPGFRAGTAEQAADIVVSGRLAGRIEIHFTGDTAIYGETPFLPEETDLINALASRIGKMMERHRSEEALRESEERFSRAIAGTGAGLWDWDMVNGRVFFSPQWKSMLGYEDQEVTNDFSGWKNLWHPDDAARIEKAVSDYLEGRTAVYEIVHRLRHKDGSWHWILTRGDIHRNAAGKPVRWVGTNIDVTPRKLAEEALKAANKKLNLLASITRHDIKNQLMALNGYILLSADAIGSPDKLRDFFALEEKITENIGRQISFTKDYEDLGVKAPAWQDVSRLVADVATTLPLQRIRLEVDTPSLEIYADPLLVKVFYNLIENSLHYGGEKMTTIRLAAERPGEDIRIIYSDDGEGIANAVKKMLFTKGFGKHTGLGLFLSREILAITGITITETGEPGKGARFEMIVPKGAFRFTGDRRFA